ncbi:hypothetical protein BT63DRAFT_423890 [Microthyrium microscopicum]|uniref:Ankyrin n=1 Tax=Microthyrium microscopicum TaxID=703497 RepID=A0A6A6UCD9_9PEZI|nr:hypothetical protein BT63DRAFT_423890 [Microthyrium microscopicum]
MDDISDYAETVIGDDLGLGGTFSTRSLHPIEEVHIHAATDRFGPENRPPSISHSAEEFLHTSQPGHIEPSVDNSDTFPKATAIAKARGKRSLLNDQQRLQLDQSIWSHSFEPPATQGSIALQKGLIEGADPNPDFAVPHGCFDSNHGLAWRAAYCCNVPCLRLALTYGASPDIAAYEKEKSRYITPLFLSAEALEYEAVQLLLLSNANTVSNGRNLLEVVCSSPTKGKEAQQLRIVELIVGEHDNFGHQLDTAVDMAVGFCTSTVTKYLIRKGAAPTSLLDAIYRQPWEVRLNRVDGPLRHANQSCLEICRAKSKPGNGYPIPDLHYAYEPPLKCVPPESWIHMAIWYYLSFKNFNSWLAYGVTLANRQQDLLAMRRFLEAGASVLDTDSLIYQVLKLFYGTVMTIGGSDDVIAVLQVLAERGVLFDTSKVRDWGEWPYFWQSRPGRFSSGDAVRRFRCSFLEFQEVCENAARYLTFESAMEIRTFLKETDRVKVQVLKMAFAEKVEEHKSKSRLSAILGPFSSSTDSRKHVINGYPWYGNQTDEAEATAPYTRAYG